MTQLEQSLEKIRMDMNNKEFADYNVGTDLSWCFSCEEALELLHSNL